MGKGEYTLDEWLDIKFNWQCNTLRMGQLDVGEIAYTKYEGLPSYIGTYYDGQNPYRVGVYEFEEDAKRAVEEAVLKAISGD